MHLEWVWYPNNATFARLVSCCPVLEELKVVGYPPNEVVLVHSLSLKMLKFELQDSYDNYEVEIDAPLLHFLTIHDQDSESYIIKNLAPNAKLDISLGFDEASVYSKRNSIHDFLPGISKVGEMIIYAETFKVFHHYSKFEQPLPQFDYMCRLDATCCLSDLKWLPTFLARCPNLKSLVLTLDNYYDKIDSEEMNHIRLSFVPECLLSSLKSIDIKSRFSGNAAEMKLVRYLLENSLILQKLSLRLNNYHANENDILKKLLKIPRRSITCQVVVLGR